MTVKKVTLYVHLNRHLHCYCDTALGVYMYISWIDTCTSAGCQADIVIVDLGGFTLAYHRSHINVSDRHFPF